MALSVISVSSKLSKMEDMVAPIVALNGIPRSGKSVVADYLVRNHGFKVHKVSAPLKNMLRALGLTEEHIEGSLKDVPSDLLGGKTPHWAMQTLGKEWRDLIHPDLWLFVWDKTRPEGPVVVDDLRFPNEVTFFRARGARLLRIERSGIASSDTDPDFERKQLSVDAVITNNGAIEDLEVIVGRCLRELGVQLPNISNTEG